MVRHAKEVTGDDPNPRIIAKVEADHSDPINIGPILAYLCSEKASHISGEVFETKASGIIERYSFPPKTASVKPREESGFMCPMDELEGAFKSLLGEAYVSPASKKHLAKGAQ